MIIKTCGLSKLAIEMEYAYSIKSRTIKLDRAVELCNVRTKVMSEEILRYKCFGYACNIETVF